MGLGEQFGAVLRAAQTGADWALSALYRDLHPSLLRYLRSQEPKEADDLASEVWVDVAANLTRFEGDESSFRKWIFTIARRRLIDFRRRAVRRKTDVVAIEDLPEAAAPIDVEAEAVGTVSAQDAIARIVDVLSPDQAEVVLLRLLGGLSSEEIGAVVRKRPGTVRVLQHRALERLAHELSAESVTGSSQGAM